MKLPLPDISFEGVTNVCHTRGPYIIHGYIDQGQFVRHGLMFSGDRNTALIIHHGNTQWHIESRQGQSFFYKHGNDPIQADFGLVINYNGSTLSKGDYSVEWSLESDTLALCKNGSEIFGFSTEIDDYDLVRLNLLTNVDWSDCETAACLMCMSRPIAVRTQIEEWLHRARAETNHRKYNMFFGHTR